MAREIAFTTYLKLLQLPDGPRKSELAKMLVGKGFRYWRSLQSVASEAVKPSANLKALEQKIEDQCKEKVRQKYNKNGLSALFNWARGKTCKPVEPLPEIVVPFGSCGLAVRLRPDVSFELDGKFFSMALWATTKPALTKEILSVGLFVMERAFYVKGHTDHLFLIFDTIANRVFDKVEDVSSTLLLLKVKHDALKKDWIELNGPPPPPPPGAPKDDDYLFPTSR